MTELRRFSHSTLDRFWSKVDRAGDCWLWTASVNHAGYGTFNFKRQCVLAHRLAYTIEHGDPGDLCVLHHCDTPPCVRPEHLWLGSRADNNADRHRKGRTRPGGGFRAFPIDRRGECNGRAKLTSAATSEIRQLYAAGRASHRALAAQFGVSRTAIRFLLQGVTWN